MYSYKKTRAKDQRQRGIGTKRLKKRTGFAAKRPRFQYQTDNDGHG